MNSVRMDNWTEEQDLLLAEIILRNAREGKTLKTAFEESSKKLNRSISACTFRWNTNLKSKYQQAYQLAKNYTNFPKKENTFKKEEPKKENINTHEQPLTITEEKEFETEQKINKVEKTFTNSIKTTETSLIQLMIKHIEEWTQLNSKLEQYEKIIGEPENNKKTSDINNNTEYIRKLEAENSLLKEENEDFKKMLKIINRAERQLNKERIIN